MRTQTENGVLSIEDMVCLWGVHRMAISEIARCHGLQPKVVPRRGNERLFDKADQDVIRKALGLNGEPALAASA